LALSSSSHHRLLRVLLFNKKVWHRMKDGSFFLRHTHKVIQRLMLMAHFFLSSFGVHTVIYRHSTDDYWLRKIVAIVANCHACIVSWIQCESHAPGSLTHIEKLKRMIRCRVIPIIALYQRSPEDFAQHFEDELRKARSKSDKEFQKVYERLKRLSFNFQFTSI